jgi:hypothetical protein
MVRRIVVSFFLLSAAALVAGPGVAAESSAEQSLQDRATERAMFAEPFIVRWEGDPEVAQEDAEEVECELVWSGSLKGRGNKPPEGVSVELPSTCVDDVTADILGTFESRFTPLDVQKRGAVEVVMAGARTRAESIIRSSWGSLGTASASDEDMAAYQQVVPVLAHQIQLKSAKITIGTQTLSQKSGKSVEFLVARASVTGSWLVWKSRLAADAEMDLGSLGMNRSGPVVYAVKPDSDADLDSTITYLVHESMRQMQVSIAASAITEAAREGLYVPSGQTVGVDKGKTQYLVDLGRAEGLEVDQTVFFYDVTRRNADGACNKPYRPYDDEDDSSACVRRIAYGRVVNVADNVDIDGERLTVGEAQRRGKLVSSGRAAELDDQAFLDTWTDHVEHCTAAEEYDKVPEDASGLSEEEKLLAALAPKRAEGSCSEYPAEARDVASAVRIVGTGSRVEGASARRGVPGFTPSVIIDGRGGIVFGPHLAGSIGAKKPGAAVDIGVTALVPTGRFTQVPEFYGMIDADLFLIPNSDVISNLFTIAFGIQKGISLGPVSLRGGFGVGFFTPFTKEGTPAHDFCDDDDTSPCAGFMVRGVGAVEFALDPRAALDLQLRATAGFAQTDITGTIFTPRPTGIQFNIGFNYRI